MPAHRDVQPATPSSGTKTTRGAHTRGFARAWERLAPATRPKRPIAALREALAEPIAEFGMPPDPK